MVVRVVEEGALCCVAEDENPTDHFLMTAVSVFRLILVLFSGALIRLKNLLELKLKGRYQILFPSCAAVLLSLNVKQCKFVNMIYCISSIEGCCYCER